MSGWFTTLMNCRICRNGDLIEGERLVVSDDNGLILESTGYIGGDAIDLENGIIAPGFIDLQLNGAIGFHFESLEAPQAYHDNMDRVARYLASTGVTGFYPTYPTVAEQHLKKLLPLARPREIEGGASILGAHAEGPYLNESKRGAHDARHFLAATVPPTTVYGSIIQNNETVKMVTLAPELNESLPLIERLVSAQIRVSLGHSNASFARGLQALKAGATCITHTMNAMSPFHHREPGLAGLITASAATTENRPYFSIIADGSHLHPAVASMLFQANPKRCVLVTDSIELTGLPDGIYPGNAQIAHNQFKIGNRTVIEGTDTLVGSCVTLQQCIQNLIKWSGCTVAEAVRCVTENVADLMGDETRGRLEQGRRADFVVLDDEANVMQTWIGGRKVWESTSKLL